jgi:hypothetical protein
LICQSSASEGARKLPLPLVKSRYDLHIKLSIKNRGP